MAKINLEKSMIFYGKPKSVERKLENSREIVISLLDQNILFFAADVTLFGRKTSVISKSKDIWYPVVFEDKKVLLPFVLNLSNEDLAQMEEKGFIANVQSN